MSLLIAALILISSIAQNEGAKILAMFPIPSISHQVVFRPITQELARRGHQVTVITPDPAFPKGGTPVNLTEIDVHDLSYSKWAELYQLTSMLETDLVTQMDETFKMIVRVVELQLQVEEVKKIIAEEKFDLLILEACAKPALVLSHVFKVPVILMSSLGPVTFNVEHIGASWHPVLYPHNLSQRLNNMTKWEKIVEWWNFYRLQRILNDIVVLEDEMSKRLFGPNTPSVNELVNNVEMLFLNIHPVWEGNRPVPPNVIYMWGLSQKTLKELPKDLKTYLDSSINGVIYMSLGTNVVPSLLPAEKVQMIIKVFSELPYDVLWKWDKDELPGRTENIRISKWLPQSDLLRHPKIKLFITQGGLQSTDEAITAGVPLIGIPMLGDQWYNVEKYVYHKIGVRLDMGTLTEEKFRNAINTVIGDESYRHNIRKLHRLMIDEPHQPLDKAIWWIEYIIRHGSARHLRSPAANMAWAEYLELELLLTVLAAILTVIVMLVLTVYSLWRYCFKIRLEKLKSY